MTCPSSIKVGTHVRLTADLRQKGVQQDVYRRVLRPDWTGIVTAIRKDTATCRHASESCICDPGGSRRRCWYCGGTGAAFRRMLPLAQLEPFEGPDLAFVVMLRRRKPQRPATFADLRANYDALKRELQGHPVTLRLKSFATAMREAWRPALDQRLGGIDEIAVVLTDGTERVVMELPLDIASQSFRKIGPGKLGLIVDDLLEQADERGYWNLPAVHEHRVCLRTVLTYPIEVPRG